MAHAGCRAKPEPPNGSPTPICCATYLACSSWLQSPAWRWRWSIKGRVWRRGFGRAIEDPAQPVSEETVFEAASLGKPVFAYAVLRMADAGVLDLDRPLYDYLPLPDANNPRMKRVTPRHVLSHTTGLPNWRQQPGSSGTGNRSRQGIQLLGGGVLLSPASRGGAERKAVQPG